MAMVSRTGSAQCLMPFASVMAVPILVSDLKNHARSSSFWAKALVALLALVLDLSVAGAHAEISQPRTIRVALDNAYPPYSFQSEDGKLQGILIDQWRAWEEKTGVKVEFRPMNWSEVVERMRTGEFDVIGSIVETAARREFLDFTAPFATMEVPIFFRKNISGITDLASLRGFALGVKMCDQHVDIFKTNGVTTLIPFRNHDEIIRAAKQHNINVFAFDAPSAHYFLNKHGMGNEFRQSPPIFRDQLRRAVRKGDTATMQIVTEGFAAISADELKEIDEKWFGRTINGIGRYVTYAAYAVVIAILLISGLYIWNRTLIKRILQRTAALGESEGRFRRLVELMPVAVYVCDNSGIIQSYNTHAAELWGREPKLGGSDQRYCGSMRLYSSDGKPISHEKSAMAEVLKTEVRARDLEQVIERPDGSRITVLSNIAPLRNSEGNVIGAMNCFQDITERKRMENALRKSENELRLSIDTIPAMAWMVLPDGTMEFINQRWREYAGLSLEEARKEPTCTIHPEDISRVLEKWSRDMRAGKSSEDEMRLRRADGAFRWFLVRTAPLFDERGNIVRWYGTSADIEDRKRAEQALRETQTTLARVTRATVVGELTTSIAHEVNQPLAAVVTNAGAALRWLDGNPPNLDETREALLRIVRDGNRASEVVTRIRALLKNGTPIKSKFDLGETIAEIVALTENEARRRQILVQTRLASNLPLVTADRVQIQQVLMNLTANALDSLKEVNDRSRSLTVEAGLNTPTTVLVTVHDTGIGIDSERMKHIFEPFYTTKPNGVGFGLSISRSIIEAHGGHLWVNPNKGLGATFQFSLPVQNGGAV